MGELYSFPQPSRSHLYLRLIRLWTLEWFFKWSLRWKVRSHVRQRYWRWSEWMSAWRTSLNREEKALEQWVQTKGRSPVWEYRCWLSLPGLPKLFGQWGQAWRPRPLTSVAPVSLGSSTSSMLSRKSCLRVVTEGSACWSDDCVFFLGRLRCGRVVVPVEVEGVAHRQATRSRLQNEHCCTGPCERNWGLEATSPTEFGERSKTVLLL